MCPNETAHLTYEFKDHFVIGSEDKRYKGKKYIKNKQNERGKKVSSFFEYSSGANKFLNISQIIQLNKKISFDSI